MSVKNELIAFCGLDCSKCDARIATATGDDELRKRVAKNWSELNGVEITPEMINCDGCRIDGRKTPYCASLCPIKKCAKEKGFETCADCPDVRVCERVGAIFANDEDARKNLGLTCP